MRDAKDSEVVDVGAVVAGGAYAAVAAIASISGRGRPVEFRDVAGSDSRACIIIINT